MATTRQWIASALTAAAVLLPLTAIGVYAANPFGVQSYDPRQRISGYGIYREMVSGTIPGYDLPLARRRMAEARRMRE